MSVVPKVFFNGFTGRGNACKLERAKSLRAEAPRKVRGRFSVSLTASAYGKCMPQLRIGLAGARATDTEQRALGTCALGTRHFARTGELADGSTHCSEC